MLGRDRERPGSWPGALGVVVWWPARRTPQRDNPRRPPHGFSSEVTCTGWTTTAFNVSRTRRRLEPSSKGFIIESMPIRADGGWSAEMGPPRPVTQGGARTTGATNWGREVRLAVARHRVGALDTRAQSARSEPQRLGAKNPNSRYGRASKLKCQCRAGAYGNSGCKAAAVG